MGAGSLKMEIEMSKIAVITDSNAHITAAEAGELGIGVVPMPFMIGEETFYEGITLFVYIPMSSGLSGSCQSARMLADDYDGKVQVVNNQRISVTQKRSVLDALDLAKKGMTAAEIREELERVKYESSIYIMLDTLKYLKKGGRITPAAAAIGSLLRIKPVLQIKGERLDAFSAVRGPREYTRSVRGVLTGSESSVPGHTRGGRRSVSQRRVPYRPRRACDRVLQEDHGIIVSGPVHRAG